MSEFLKILKTDVGNAEDRLSGDGYPTPLASQCDTCERKSTDGSLTCEAFPKGIPTLILFNVWDHEIPFHMDGFDDHGLTYVAKGEGEDGLDKILKGTV